MDKQFYICHSSKDLSLAEALVDELESNGFVCRLTSRDAPLGSDTQKYVDSAILNSTALLLVFSENATESLHIRSELDTAANQRIPIISLKFREAPISKSISYYTHSQKWIDCTTHQANTREIVETLLNTVKDPKPMNTTDSHGIMKYKWYMAGGLLLLLLIVSLFHKSSNSGTDVSSFLNTAVGGRDSWDYASDIIPLNDGGLVAAGGWDWGLWSEIWIAKLDSSHRLIYSWSDSISGGSRPLLLPTADDGCITVYASFSEADTSGFVFRTVRLGSKGDVLWNSEERINYAGGGHSVLSSLHWLPDSTAVASFTTRSSTDDRTAVHFAILDSSNGSGTTFSLPCGIETLSVATSIEGDILHSGRDPLDNTSVLRVLDSDGHQTGIHDLRENISCVAFNPDNSVIASATTGGEEGILSVVKLNEDFEQVWESTFDHSIRGTLTDIIIRSDGSIVLVGSTSSTTDDNSDGRVLCLSKSGKIQWETVIDAGGDDHILSVDETREGVLLLAGSTTCFSGRDAWLMQMTSDGEYNPSCVQGIDLFTEDWENGFVGQSFWRIGSNNPPTVTRDSTGNFALTIIESPAMLRESYRTVPGLCFSAEVAASPGMVTEDNWISIGATDCSAAAIFEGDPYCEFRWNYTPEQKLTGTLGRPSSPQIFTESVRLTESKPILFAIEQSSDSLLFVVNDSLLYGMPSPDGPDSLNFFINGNSISAPHSVDNIRVYLRKW